MMLSVATLVAPIGTKLLPAHIDVVANFFEHVEKTIPSADGRAADIFFTGSINSAPHEFAFDVLIQPAATRRKKILIADMESTVIEQEMLDELATMIGVGDKVAETTRRAMNGELDFAEALRERVALLKGQPESLLHKAAEKMTLMPGAAELMASIKQTGGKCWLVSGGFTFFIKIIAERLGFDDYYGNELVIEKGVLTGEVKNPILDKTSKKQLLEQACATYGYTLSDAIAVGDGANDIPMLQTCAEGGGLGVAYRAKPAVRKVIHSQINHTDLSALIYAQGR